MQQSRILLMLLCMCGTLALPAFAQKQNQSLAIEDALAALSFHPQMPLDLSPDSQWVAYALIDPRRNILPDDKYPFFTRTGVPTGMSGYDIWITNTKSGESKNLTGGKGSSWGPVWSPDGNHLAFYSDRSGQAHLWLWERSSRRLKQLTDLVVHPFYGFEVVRWTPDSRKIVVKVLPEGISLEDAAKVTTPSQGHANNEEKYPGSTARIYRSPEAQNSVRPAPWMKESTGDLALIDVSGGKAQRIGHGIRPRGV